MRLVAYDRRGHRRLGALRGPGVVDLPDLVGHPAFPTSMERLVARNGGTVMDAVRAALERADEVDRLLQPRARLLPTVLPTSLRSPDAVDGHRPLLGPEEEIPWPGTAGWLDYEPKVAAVIGRSARDLTPEQAEATVFGYTLVNDWTVRDANGSPERGDAVAAVALGPCVATVDDLDPERATVLARVDGEEWARGSLVEAARALPRIIAAASRGEELQPGETFATNAFGRPLGRAAWPGALVELEAEGIGLLRNRLGRHD